MAHSIEVASSGRAKCRGCGTSIKKGELRLGERLPNVFTDAGEMTLWFHLVCGAYRRPEAFLQAVADDEHGIDIPDVDALKEQAQLGVEHPRLQRLASIERAKSGRATCRQCRETIDKGEVRLVLQYFEDARFSPSGFLHPGCVADYVGTDRIGPRIRLAAGPEPDAELLAPFAT